MDNQSQVQLQLAQISLELETHADPLKNVMIFGDFSSFDKSFLTVNLGLHWANNSYRTLIIDLDQKYSGIEKTFDININNVVGMDERLFNNSLSVASGDATKIKENLWVIPSGMKRMIEDIPNLNEKLGVVLGELSHDYDRILLNMPVGFHIEGNKLRKMTHLVDAALLIQSLSATKVQNLRSYFSYTQADCYMGIVYLGKGE